MPRVAPFSRLTFTMKSNMNFFGMCFAGTMFGGVHLSPPASDPQMCDLAARVLKWCHQHDILTSVENPSASPAWRGALGKTCLALGLLKTSLHQCMFGDLHAKHSTFFHNYPELRRIGVTCDESHSHAQRASEVLPDYPTELCNGCARGLVCSSAGLGLCVVPSR